MVECGQVDRWHGSCSSGSDSVVANLTFEGSALLSKQEIANQINSVFVKPMESFQGLNPAITQWGFVTADSLQVCCLIRFKNAYPWEGGWTQWGTKMIVEGIWRHPCLRSCRHFIIMSVYELLGYFSFFFSSSLSLFLINRIVISLLPLYYTFIVLLIIKQFWARPAGCNLINIF